MLKEALQGSMAVKNVVSGEILQSKVWRSGINWVFGDHCVFSDPQILDKSPSSAIWLMNRQDGSIVWISARDNEALLKIIVNNRLDAWDNLRI